MLAFHLVNGVPVLIMFALSLLTTKALDGEVWWNDLMVNYPNSYRMMQYCYSELQVCACGGLIKESKATSIMLAVILIEIILYCLLGFLGPWYIFYCLKKSAKNMTQKNYNRQKNILRLQFFQVGIFILFLHLYFINYNLEIIKVQST